MCLFGVSLSTEPHSCVGTLAQVQLSTKANLMYVQLHVTLQKVLSKDAPTCTYILFSLKVRIHENAQHLVLQNKNCRAKLLYVSYLYSRYGPPSHVNFGRFAMTTFILT